MKQNLLSLAISVWFVPFFSQDYVNIPDTNFPAALFEAISNITPFPSI